MRPEIENRFGLFLEAPLSREKPPSKACGRTGKLIRGFSIFISRNDFGGQSSLVNSVICSNDRSFAGIECFTNQFFCTERLTRLAQSLRKISFKFVDGLK